MLCLKFQKANWFYSKIVLIIFGIQEKEKKEENEKVSLSTTNLD